MRAIIFGATGMVGQGVLRECLLDPQVESVATVGRSTTGQQHAKLKEILHDDLLRLAPIEAQLSGYDACFFCLGVASAGLTEEEYRRVTKDYAVSVAKTLAEKNAGMTFIFISGAGADSTGKSRTMWARVKGEAENAVLQMPFKDAYVIRPAIIQPLHGITSRTASYRIGYKVLWPVLSLSKALLPNYTTTTEALGRVMLKLAREGFSKKLLESRDINAFSKTLA